MQFSIKSSKRAHILFADGNIKFIAISCKILQRENNPTKGKLSPFHGDATYYVTWFSFYLPFKFRDAVWNADDNSYAVKAPITLDISTTILSIAFQNWRDKSKLI